MEHQRPGDGVRSAWRNSRLIEKWQMIIGIDPKVDYAFKHLFGREVTRPILIDVIDSVLQPPPGHELRELELLNPFNPKETLDDKLSILDIKARDQSGRQFNVEMQMMAYPAYDKRILYYASRLHQQQLHEGEDYSELRSTISISFLNHVLFPQIDDWHLQFTLMERSRHFPFNEDIVFHTLELPKFKKQAANLDGGLDNWLYFLRFAGRMDCDHLPETLASPLIKRAFEELKMLTEAEIERERYEARLKAQLDYNSLMKAPQRYREQGLQEGLQEGRQKGLQEGLCQGEMIGAVHLCQRLLNLPETPTSELALLPLDQLTSLADDLQARVISIRSGS
jgi:predicted transposase/invertase (TIGR01784 family)